MPLRVGGQPGLHSPVQHRLHSETPISNKKKEVLYLWNMLLNLSLCVILDPFVKENLNLTQNFGE